MIGTRLLGLATLHSGDFCPAILARLASYLSGDFSRCSRNSRYPCLDVELLEVHIGGYQGDVAVLATIAALII